MTATKPLEVIPSIDLLHGKVVRLLRGDFATATEYGNALEIIERWQAPEGTRIHVVDLEGSRTGGSVETELIAAIAKRYRIQIGGGIRSVADAERLIDAGAEKIVLGTVLGESAEIVEAIVQRVGPARVVAALDLRDGEVRVSGWSETSAQSLSQMLKLVESAGVEEILVTDVGQDGTLAGPAFDLYRDLFRKTSLRILASGGVGTLRDLTSLARVPGVRGVIIGKALHERSFTFREALATSLMPDSVPVRIVPCLDVRDGRVVKGVNFSSIRDAGDPVECAMRYEKEGADELVLLDISATERERQTSLDTIRNVAGNLFVPLTVGGGVRTVDDFRRLLGAGADRVAINTAAVLNPQLIHDVAREFGSQAVVLACDARKEGDRYRVVIRSGSAPTELGVVDWCRKAEELGAGEILLTSIDRDGTESGYDLALLRAVSSAVRIGVIASGGAGNEIHFREAVELGGVGALLAASLFHDRELSIGGLKGFLLESGIPVRLPFEGVV